MSVCERFMISSTAGPALDARLWKPANPPRAVVQLVHGMAEHIDRYEELAQALSAAGIAVAGHHQLGHGPKAPVKGFFADKDGWQHLLEDIHRLRGVVQEQYPGTPYFLLGHSMGSFLARCYAAEYAQGLSGVILSGTGDFAPASIKAGAAIAQIFCLFGGRKKPANLIDQLAFSSNNKAFEPARTDFDWLSQDAQEVDRYLADECCGFVFTGGGYRDLFQGIRQMIAPQTVQRTPKNLPMLFVSGDHDPVGGMGQGVEKVAADYRAAGVENVQVRLYPDARHELFHEKDRMKVFRDVIIFVDECLKA